MSALLGDRTARVSVRLWQGGVEGTWPSARSARASATASWWTPMRTRQTHSDDRYNNWKCASYRGAGNRPYVVRSHLALPQGAVHSRSVRECQTCIRVTPVLAALMPAMDVLPSLTYGMRAFVAMQRLGVYQGGVWQERDIYTYVYIYTVYKYPFGVAHREVYVSHIVHG